MRWFLAVAVAILATGCGGGRQLAQQAPREKQVDKLLYRCTHASGGFRACTTFGFPVRGERSSIQHREGVRWKLFAAPPKVRYGWWRRIVVSPDRRMLLAQWSGECEIQSTYLVSTENRQERPIFRGTTSTALGWSEDSRARVRLPAPVYGTDKRIRFRAGNYLVDPKTMAVTRERPIARRPGC
jgi:hypothetical protein